MSSQCSYSYSPGFLILSDQGNFVFSGYESHLRGYVGKSSKITKVTQAKTKNKLCLLRLTDSLSILKTRPFSRRKSEIYRILIFSYILCDLPQDLWCMLIMTHQIMASYYWFITLFKQFPVLALSTWSVKINGRRRQDFLYFQLSSLRMLEIPLSQFSLYQAPLIEQFDNRTNRTLSNYKSLTKFICRTI